MTSPRRDLNSRPLVYKTSALTPELRRLVVCICQITTASTFRFVKVSDGLLHLPIFRDSLPPVYLKPAFNWSRWSVARAPHLFYYLIISGSVSTLTSRSFVAYDVVKWPDQFKTARELMLKMNFTVWFVKSYYILKNYRKKSFFFMKITENSSLLFQNLRVKNYLPGDWVSEKDLAKGKL